MPKGIDMMEYVVCLDLKDHRRHRIHKTSCRLYVGYLDDMKAGVVSTTTRWQGPYSSEEEANRRTHVTRVCLECNPLPSVPSVPNVPNGDTPRRGVVITDIDIPFSRIMVIVLQWGLASLIWYVVLAVVTVVIVVLLWNPATNR